MSGTGRRKIDNQPNLPLLVAIPLLALCGGDSTVRGGGADGGQQERMNVASEPAFSNRQSGLRDALRLVVRHAEAWERLWTDVAGPRTPPPDLPQVDFEQEMVIVAAMGMRGTGGFGIEIEEVYQEAARLVAVAVETSPGPDCMTIQAFSAPAVGVRVARSDLPVTFVERRVTLECE